MTDPQTPTPSAAPASRWVKIALVISVAINLAVAGLVAGAWLGGGPRRAMMHDLSFGPFSDALSPEDRRALRSAFFKRAGEFRKAREAARAEFDALLAALRSEPLDPVALDAALTAIETRNAERLALGRDLIEERFVEMTAEDRKAFADRLDVGLHRGFKRD
jgi:uncharacterized membrane protein